MRWARPQAEERFPRPWSGPYRASVFFELSLDHLIAMTDLEVTDKALAALRRFGSDGALASTAGQRPARRRPRRQLAIVNRSARESVLMSGTEAAIAGAVASPQCFPADLAVELWLPPFSISRGR